MSLHQIDVTLIRRSRGGTRFLIKIRQMQGDARDEKEQVGDKTRLAEKKSRRERLRRACEDPAWIEPIRN